MLHKHHINFSIVKDEKLNIVSSFFFSLQEISIFFVSIYFFFVKTLLIESELTRIQCQPGKKYNDMGVCVIYLEKLDRGRIKCLMATKNDPPL